MKHVMHDFESWALKSPVPVLLSIGAVLFDGDQVIERFHVRIDPADCQRLGLEIEADTVEWWMHDDRAEARRQLDAMPKVDLFSALDGFSMWVQQTAVEERGSLWSNGSNFDNAKLKNIYHKIGLEWPASYKQEECYRTMRNRFGDLAEFQRTGVHHGALDDAESQALHLIGINRVLVNRIEDWAGL